MTEVLCHYDSAPSTRDEVPHCNVCGACGYDGAFVSYCKYEDDWLCPECDVWQSQDDFLAAKGRV